MRASDYFDWKSDKDMSEFIAAFNRVKESCDEDDLAIVIDQISEFFSKNRNR